MIEQDMPPALSALFMQAREAHMRGDRTTAFQLMQKAKGLEESYANIARDNERANPAMSAPGGLPERIAAGAGGAIADLALGLKQRFATDPNKVAELQAQVEQKRAIDAPLLDTGGGITGNILGNVAAGVAASPFLPASAPVIAGGVVGGALGGLQPTAEGESATINAGKGAAFGAGGAWLGRAMFGPKSAGGAPASDIARRTELLNKGRELGLQFTPADRTGSGLLRRIESQFDTRPYTAGPLDAIRANNATAAKRIANEFIGGSATGDVSDVALKIAREQAADAYKVVRASGLRTVPVSTLKQQIDDIAKRYDPLMTGNNASFKSDNLVKTVMEWAKKGKGKIDADQLVTYSSNAGEKAHVMLKDGSTYAQGKAMLELKDTLDDAITKTLPDAQKAEFLAMRKQYANVSKLIDSKAAEPATGDFSPLKFANFLKTKSGGDLQGYTLGKNDSDMYNLARVATQFKEIGNSRTAERTPMALRELLSAPLKYAASRAYFSKPGSAVVTGTSKVLNYPRVAELLAQRANLYAPVTEEAMRYALNDKKGR